MRSAIQRWRHVETRVIGDILHCRLTSRDFRPARLESACQRNKRLSCSLMRRSSLAESVNTFPRRRLRRAPRQNAFAGFPSRIVINYLSRTKTSRNYSSIFFPLSSSFSTDDFLNAPACETRTEQRGESLQIQILISVCWQIDPSGEHLQKSSPRPKTLQRCSRLGRETSLPA